jgi:hypothetical protein
MGARLLSAAVWGRRPGAHRRSRGWRAGLGLVAVAGLLGGGLASIGTPSPAHAAGPAWSVASSPNVLDLANGELRGVSCVSASFCMAVGDYEYAAGQTFAEVWNGSTWSIVPTASKDISDILFGVSCVSASFCTAVGQYTTGTQTSPGVARTLIETWNGSGWSLAASPNNGAGGNFLQGVSCVSASSCTAVGHYDSASGIDVTLVESSNGSTWSIVSSRNRGTGGDSLDGVSCLSAGACTAVGSFTALPEGTAETLVETWNGSAWSTVASPDTFQGGGGLNAVSCVSASSCTAVGGYESATSGTGATLVVSWNGTAWSQVSSPDSGTASNYLSGVSCVTASFCVAVGTGSESTLIETWNGGKWSITPSPSPGTYENDLYGVSCRSASSCAAVGRSYTSSLIPEAAAESWNGSTWSAVATPDHQVFADGLSGVSCVTASFCAAVGSYVLTTSIVTGGSVSKTLIESWNGSAWSKVTSPNRYQNNNALNAVSCLSASSCTAVGTFLTSNGEHTQTLVESWNGSAWSKVPSPNNGSIRESNALVGVSCVSASFCVAVGSYSPTGGSSLQALVESWNGSAWSIVPTPATSSSNLDAVSCVSASFCTAVGGYVPSGGSVAQTLIETWNGSSWSIVPAPASSTNEYELKAVSCVSASFCAAVGQVGLSTLTEEWNGSSWSVVPSPDNGTNANYLDSVSCSSASSCAAVGSYQAASGVSLTLAESWDGTAWSIVTSPNPTAGNNALLGVSCLSASSCTAAGDSYTASGNQQTLIERYG